MGGRFAKATEVPEEKTRADIELVLAKYGATGYGIIHEGDTWRIVFKIQGRMVQMDFNTPKDHLRKDAINRVKSEANQKAAWEQEKRSYWRAIYNVIKFKLEAIAIGYSTIEREFLSDVLLPDGSIIDMSQRVIGDWAHCYFCGAEMPAVRPVYNLLACDTCKAISETLPETMTLGETRDYIQAQHKGAAS